MELVICEFYHQKICKKILVVITYLHTLTVHVTDVHNSLDRVEQVKSWLSSREQKVDMVLVSGDIADGPMDWELSEQEVEKIRHDLEAIVQSFTTVSSNVYYIPGNVRQYSYIESLVLEHCIVFDRLVH